MIRNIGHQFNQDKMAGTTDVPSTKKIGGLLEVVTERSTQDVQGDSRK